MNEVIKFWLTTGAVALFTAVLSIFIKQIVSLIGATTKLTNEVNKLQISDAEKEVRLRYLEKAVESSPYHSVSFKGNCMDITNKKQ